MPGDGNAYAQAEGVRFKRGESRKDRPASLDLVCAASFADQATPQRRFLDERKLFPMANVSLFAGDGGTGKSLLAMQLGVGASSTGMWLGRGVRRGPVLYFSAEDDLDETHIRLKEIACAEGLDLASCGGLHIAIMAGLDAVLAGLGDGGRIVATGLYKALDQRIAEIQPVAVILDNSADIYAADENVRTLVRQFVGMLRHLAIKHDIAIILLSHPSLTGLNSGTGTSGSTAWSNTVRSRLFLQRVLESDGDRRTVIEVDPDLRVLKTMKANMGRVGNEIRVRWEAGCFVSLEEPTSADTPPGAAAKAERVFLHLLRWHLAHNIFVSPNRSLTWAPSVFARHVQAEGIRSREFDVAMQTLLNSGKITTATHGSPAKQRTHLDFPTKGEGGE